MSREIFKVIVGLDEAGRGPLAASVTAAAVTICPNSRFKKSQTPNLKIRTRLVSLDRTLVSARKEIYIPKIRTCSLRSQNLDFSLPSKIKDSKKLTFQKREEIYKILKNNPQVKFGTGRVSEKVIDKINIFEATKLAMERAVKNLERKIAKPVDYLIIDGNFGINLPLPQKSIIKGDEKVFLIKLASIVAKVTRDRMMLRYHKKYSEYRFDKHKGYGTKLHFEMLKKFGPCKIHRKTFGPVRRYCKV